MVRWYAGCTSRIVFDDFTSTPFVVDRGLDQGNPHSGISFLLNNAGLARIPCVKDGEHGVKFVDDNTLIATGANFTETHRKLTDMMQRP
ncbi:hypothetical protein B0H17DRAFT_950773, partial [Mycena rosella]